MRHEFQDREGFEIVPEGVYLISVAEATEKMSKQGNDMLELKCAVNGHAAVVWDYLTAGEKTAWKIDVFLKATGHAPAKGQVVDLDAESVKGWYGWAEISVGKTNSTPPRDRNELVRWLTDRPLPARPPAITASNNPAPAPQPIIEGNPDDDLPW